jgi:hypothetical protein
MDESKRPKKSIKDIIANNPRYDREYTGSDDEEEERIREEMLYDAKQEKSKNTIRRMLTAYKRRKRYEKIDKLTNYPTLWKGLEGYIMNEDINAFISHFRRHCYSGERLTFRKWMDKVEDLLDKVS